MQNPLKKAIEIAGGQARLGAHLGISQPAISQAIKRGGYLTPKHCIKLEQLYPGRISRQELRPHDWQDIWPELA